MTGELFRLVNDRIHEFGPPSLTEFDFVCECGNESRTDRYVLVKKYRHELTAM